MDPSSDPSQHFRHQHHQGQHHPRLGPAQSSSSMPSPSSSHAPSLASPPASTAASSNPFVRSHHDQLPAPIAGTRSPASETRQRPLPESERSSSSSSQSSAGDVFVAIKCPSLDKDSAVVKVKATDTVLSLKQIIEATWAGAPRASGMRCIRSGRILSDTEVLGHLSENLDEAEPLSLHLVIRPDAWSDPQNRPTPSRRGSFKRQQQQQQLQHQHQHSLLRSALTPQAVPHADVDDDVPPQSSATSTEHPPHWTPAYEPYFTEPELLSMRSTSSFPAALTDVLPSSSNDMIDTTTAQFRADAYDVLFETIRVTAPENWPLLVETLSAACDEYVLLYERIYNESQAAQRVAPTSTPARSTKQSDLLTSVETTLLGWNPVRVPSEHETASGASTSHAPETEFLYQEVSHRGLPYLLRVATTSLAAQRSEALYTLLQRITTLRAMIDKLEKIIKLGRLIRAQSSTSTSASTGPTPPGAAPAQALEQGSLSRLLQSTTAALRAVTWADITAIVIPLFFVGFKVGILLSMVLRGADTVKKYFVLGMAAVYVAFESCRIVQRRMRVRRRLVRTAVPLAAPAAAPMGANVPVAPAHEEVVERQAAEDPFAPLPPPRAPVRQTARPWTTDWCLDRLAHLGLDGEDEELGLAAAHRRNPTLAGQVLSSSWLLPLVLFVVTMSPAVEQRRKRAIEERERVIRKWTRLEEERRQRVEELLEEKRAKGEAADLPHPDREGEGELQQKRVEYADRILRQRRTTEAVDVDDEDLLAAQRQVEDEEDMQDMNVF